MGPVDNSATICRCFVTAIVVDKPEINRLVGTIHYKQDHGRSEGDKGAISGSFSVADASKYRVGDAITVAIS